MNCDTNPLEAGLEYFVKLNKVCLHSKVNLKDDAIPEQSHALKFNQV